MTTEIDRLDADQTASEVELSNGMVVRIERLRTRQVLRPLRILNVGAGAQMMEMDWAENDQEAFVAQLVALAIFAIPEAEDETVAFIRSLVSPAAERGKSKEDRAWYARVEAELDEYLDNPELEDLIDIIRTVIRVEGPEMASLGKKIRALLPVSTSPGSSQSTGPKTRTRKASQGTSRKPSTSSSPSTDG